mgnify:CR=1 FL=1
MSGSRMRDALSQILPYGNCCGTLGDFVAHHSFGCLTMFDKTRLNCLARASNIKMFDHQTMLDNVCWSNTSRLARALNYIRNEDFYFAFACCYMSNKRFKN